MAAADIRDDLTCSVCLNLYMDPVTLRCGHSFCWCCINCVLDSQAANGGYSCPECREEVQLRPILRKNKALCNVVKNLPPAQEELLAAAQEKLPPAQPKLRVSGILCSYCIAVPSPALKSCLLCEASLCADHLRVHCKALEHVLTEPTSSPKARKCSIHNELLKYFCVQDGVCICISCSLAGEHRGHVVDTLEVASDKKKENLKRVSENITSKRKAIEGKLQWLQQEQSKGLQDADNLKKQAASIFSRMRVCVDILENNVLEEISRQEWQASLLMSNKIKCLEVENDALLSRICRIEELCEMTDSLAVLQDAQFGKNDYFLATNLNKELLEISDKRVPAVAGLDKSLVMDRLEDLTPIIIYLTQGIHGLGLTELTLDKNALCGYLNVSDDLKSISQSSSKSCPQTHSHHVVMSLRSFSSGVHYWDVEMSGSGKIGLCYSSLSKQSFHFGWNNKSWCLRKGSFFISVSYAVLHDNEETALYHNTSMDRFRIYLNHEAGQITFYALCNPLRHLYTFNACFTEPLHAAFWTDSGKITVL